MGYLSFTGPSYMELVLNVLMRPQRLTQSHWVWFSCVAWWVYTLRKIGHVIIGEPFLVLYATLYGRCERCKNALLCVFMPCHYT